MILSVAGIAPPLCKKVKHLAAAICISDVLSRDCSRPISWGTDTPLKVAAKWSVTCDTERKQQIQKKEHLNQLVWHAKLYSVSKKWTKLHKIHTHHCCFEVLCLPQKKILLDYLLKVSLEKNKQWQNSVPLRVESCCLQIRPEKASSNRTVYFGHYVINVPLFLGQTSHLPQKWRANEKWKETDMA